MNLKIHTLLIFVFKKQAIPIYDIRNWDNYLSHIHILCLKQTIVKLIIQFLEFELGNLNLVPEVGAAAEPRLVVVVSVIVVKVGAAVSPTMHLELTEMDSLV